MNADSLIYRFTLHSTIGVIAVKLLSKRELCRKLPEFDVLYFDDLQSVLDLGSEQKNWKTIHLTLVFPDDRAREPVQIMKKSG